MGMFDTPASSLPFFGGEANNDGPLSQLLRAYPSLSQSLPPAVLQRFMNQPSYGETDLMSPHPRAVDEAFQGEMRSDEALSGGREAPLLGAIGRMMQMQSGS